MKYEKIALPQEDGDVFLEAYIADRIGDFTRKALLVIPGGGYGSVCSEREGEPIAMAFLPHGYNAFVLHYTVGRKKPFPAQLIQATKAIKHIKDHAEEYNINPDELFVVGFSAGGHLAASTGTLWKMEEIYQAVDMPYAYNKPRGVMLMYPVISPAYQHHIASFCNLWCTDTPSAEQLDAAAIEKHVDADSSPAFVLHTANDQTVDVKNALTLAEAYSTAGVPYELHIYPDAPHGVALGNRITECHNPKYNNPAIAKWVENAAYWADSLCNSRANE
ncbi:MAG: alpha/beta hydrolase [Clostridia bacterium]|nr:alpha/beta hydrolase [Clostridia bacterium]